MEEIICKLYKKCYIWRAEYPSEEKNLRLKKELGEIYSEIGEQCSSFRYLCILYIIDNLRKRQFQEIANGHAKKIARLLHKKLYVDKHITNISSYRLSFFEKLTLCRGLKFAIPEQVSPTEVIASFERAYWFLEPNLQQDQKELTTATLRLVAVNYIHSKSPISPKALVKAIRRLKQCNVKSSILVYLVRFQSIDCLRNHSNSQFC